uniref:Bestrophin homolog n=1 Tax=Parascaris equorum TaxID=6256 RepID=A0A914S7Y0_PAREQ
MKIFAAAVIQRALVGKLIERIERRNLSLDGIKMLSPTNEMLQVLMFFCIFVPIKCTYRAGLPCAHSRLFLPVYLFIEAAVQAAHFGSAVLNFSLQVVYVPCGVSIKCGYTPTGSLNPVKELLEEISSIQPQLKTNIESGMEEVDEEQQQTANIPATVHNATETPAPVEVRREGTKEEAASKEVADQSPIQEPNANDSK